MEDKKETLVLCMGKGADKAAAESLAKRLNAPISQSFGEHFTLLMDANGISLNGYGLCLRGDFEHMLYRIRDGRLLHEMLVHIAKTKEPQPKAVDATAGMGEDAFLLAAYGYEVTMYEQNAVIAALLRDALQRAKKHPLLCDIVKRMHLIEGNSVELLPHDTKQVDLIYLDPMFPLKQKNALTNKKLQLIQKLEQPCVDETALLEAAFLAHPKRIIIKRPLKGSYLAEKKPSYTIKGKAIRYDCFAL